MQKCQKSEKSIQKTVSSMERLKAGRHRKQEGVQSGSGVEEHSSDFGLGLHSGLL